MKRIGTLLFLIFSFWNIAYTQGSTPETAAVLSVNSNSSGTLTSPTTIHFWKITTATDGYLKVVVVSDASIDIDVSLYDTDGTTGIDYDGGSGTTSHVEYFATPGTYFVKLYRYSGTSGGYTISNTLASPLRATEMEINDEPAGAVVLSPTGAADGHIGYAGTGHTDNTDFWKITTTQDGWLKVVVISDSLAADSTVMNLDLSLYDIDSTSGIDYDGGTGTSSTVDRFVRPGTYFAKVYRWAGGAGSYGITSSLSPPPLPVENEPNDSAHAAWTAHIADSVTGHIGYYSNLQTDIRDYWKFTTVSNARVEIVLVSDSLDQSGSAMDLDLTLYDVDSHSSIDYDGGSGARSEITSYLKPGTYYLQVYLWAGHGSSYSVTVKQTPPALANDVESNDSLHTAVPFSYGIETTGQIGYFGNKAYDQYDHWKFAAPGADSVYVHVISDTTADLDITVIDSVSGSTVGYDGGYGPSSQAGFVPVSGRAYYVRIYHYSGTAGSYRLIANASAAITGIEHVSDELSLPIAYELAQNYPNPFNPETEIRFHVPEVSLRQAQADGERSRTVRGQTSEVGPSTSSGERVRLVVYDLLGRRVATLVDEVLRAGVYRTRWNASQFPSGVYLYRLEAGEVSIVKKMVLAR